MSNAPDPVPPPGKPRIGIAWIIVVGILGLIFATWIYSSTKPTSASRDHEAQQPAATATP